MHTAGGTGPGLLSDLEQLERELRDVQRAIGETTGTAGAANDLVLATVTGRGEVKEIVLDARVYRDLAVGELAAEIVAAVNEARGQAERNVLEVLGTAWPAGLQAIGADPSFDPLLGELERMRSHRGRTR